MIINLLKIRWVQIYRTLFGIGIFRALFLCAIILPFMVLFLYQQLKEQGNAHYFIMGICLGLMGIVHHGRKDHHFLLKISEPIQKTYYIEYVFFSLPLLLLLVITFRFFDIFLYFFLLLLLVLFIRPSGGKVRRTFRCVTRFVPETMFEWKAGIRKNIYLIVPLYAVGITTTLLNVWVPIACLIVLSTVLWSFYAMCESREMLEAREVNPKKYLRSTLNRHLACWLALVLPVVCIACIIHHTYTLHVCVALLILTNTYICSILMKYAYYTPKTTSMTGGMLGYIILLCSFIPVISVLIVGYNIFLYGRGIKTLNNYLDDYN